MSSTFRASIRNVPPPPGSKAGNAYTRFIPREELPDFAAWAPGAFGDSRPPPPVAQPQANPPTEADVQAQAASARQAGYQDGYRDGLAALESFKQSLAAQATAQLAPLLRGMGQAHDGLQSQMAQAVAETAVQLARQVLRSELQVQPALVARVATEAVNAVLLSARQITLQLHPLDLPLVAEGAAELLAARGGRLIANPQIERGGCRVESDLGAVDARIGSRWAQAAAALGSDTPWSEGAAP